MAYLSSVAPLKKEKMKTIKKVWIRPGQLCRRIDISPINYEVMDYLPSPMLSIQEKIPSPTSKATHTAIVDQELYALLRYRSRLTKTTSSTSTVVFFESRLNQWSSYFLSLSIIKPHYPMALERAHLEAVHFTWKDSFKPSKKHSHTSIGSEKVAVVFNIGTGMKKDVKGAPFSLINVISKLGKNINSQLEKAKRENNSIYRMRVPATCFVELDVI